MPVVVNSTTDEGCQDGPHSERTASVRARELLSPRASTRHGGGVSGNGSGTKRLARACDARRQV